MARRRLFTVQTPLGHRVFLERDRWRQIIRFKHPALAGRESEVRSCSSSPLPVREGVKESDVHMYYQLAESVSLRVVTAPTGVDQRFVVAECFTRNIKPGKELWKS